MKSLNITEVCDIQVGKTPSRANLSYWGEGSLWLSIADMNQGLWLQETKETITEKAIEECNCKIVPENTVLFSFKLSIGKVGITKIPMYTNEAIAAFPIKDSSKLETKFLYYVLKSADYSIGSNKAVMGKTLNKEKLKKISIPLPPLDHQKRIVSILDAADALCQKRRQAIGLLDDYLESVFLEMFGDPLKNPKGWRLEPVKNVCNRLSDGPFGSKLKTEHYVGKGVRVIRLQNIGINEFRNDDSVYISEEYYENELKGYSCRPGEIVIATLGDPNIRACVIPDSIPLSINKADCIHCIPNSRVLHFNYLVALLNLPQFHNSFHKLVHGQTRGRVSSGQLKNVTIPVPTMELQEIFSGIVMKKRLLKKSMLHQSEELETQFQALMQKAFNGKL